MITARRERGEGRCAESRGWRIWRSKICVRARQTPHRAGVCVRKGATIERVEHARPHSAGMTVRRGRDR